MKNYLLVLSALILSTLMPAENAEAACGPADPRGTVTLSGGVTGQAGDNAVPMSMNFTRNPDCAASIKTIEITAIVEIGDQTSLKFTGNNGDDTCVAKDASNTTTCEKISDTEMQVTLVGLNNGQIADADFASLTLDILGSATAGPHPVAASAADPKIAVVNGSVLVTESTLTLIKDPTNDSGGNAAPDDFQLTVGGSAVLSGATNVFQANTALAINETQLANYSFVSITGDAKCPGALAGTVTLDPDEDVICTITNDDDAPTLTLVKEVVGGSAVATDWVLTADGTDGNDLSGAGGVSGEVIADTFALSEDAGPAGYTAGDWVCVGGSQVDASITLTLGQTATCTIVNTADAVDTTLTLVKEVVGGDAVATDWVLTADGTDANDLSGAGGASGVVLPDTFALSEDAGPGGYTAGNWVCVGGSQVDASITLAEGETATCTIINTADAVDTTLTLVKEVVGGDAVATDWVLTADGTDANDLSGAGGASGVVLPDTFALSEDAGPGGYTAGNWVCVGGSQTDASITLAEGETATCTIINTADAVDTTLTLVKEVVGGDAVATDWVLTADGTDANDLSGAGGASGVVLPDTFALSEDAGPGGYTAGNWVCVGGSQTDASITLAEGETATCTIINTSDVVDTTLTLVKEVVGGDAVATDWVLTADGTDANDLSGAGGASGVVLPDTFALSEDAGPGGYTAGNWVCVGGSQVDASITLAEGETATCTIINTADAVDTTLTLVKEVVGGDAVATDWVLTADGTDANDLSGAGGASGVVLPDTFALSEDAGPGGYTAGNWVCVGGSQTDASITLAEGETATCTIINTADAVDTTLTLVKEVVGGDAVATDWVLTADGTDANDLSGAGGASGVVLPDTFALSEDAGPGGYTAGNWVCVGGSQTDASITLAEGETATCTIINTADAVDTTLTLVKEVVGGDAVATDWVLTADGTDANDLSGAGGASGVVLPDTFALSEDAGPGDYTGSDWVCTGTGTQDDATHITLAEGQVATCTIVNTFQSNSALDLEKSANTNVYSAVDDVIFYTYTVTNEGNVPVVGQIVVTDDKIPLVDCPAGDLAPAEVMECTGTYTIDQGDIDEGSVMNTATASGDAGATVSDPAVFTATYSEPVLTLVKTAIENFFSVAGDTINYEYEVTASGGPVTGGITVVDDKTTVDCPVVDPLLPEASIVCTASYVIVADDITEGSVTNIATASGNAGGTVSNEETLIVDYLPPDTPVLSMTKTADPESFTEIGQIIYYTYIVSSVGNAPVIGPITVSDSRMLVTCDPVTSVGNGDQNLDEGESVPCYSSLVVTMEDTSRGYIFTESVAFGSDGTESPPADINVPYAPVPIPTLSEWSMILLSFLFLLFGMTYVRRRV